MTIPTKVRVQKHRAKLTAKGCGRFEVTIGRDVIAQAHALARQTKWPTWLIVQEALKKYVAGHTATSSVTVAP